MIIYYPQPIIQERGTRAAGPATYQWRSITKDILRQLVLATDGRTYTPARKSAARSEWAQSDCVVLQCLEVYCCQLDPSSAHIYGGLCGNRKVLSRRSVSTQTEQYNQCSPFPLPTVFNMKLASHCYLPGHHIRIRLCCQF